jgi:hypothetical protein
LLENINSKEKETYFHLNRKKDHNIQNQFYNFDSLPSSHNNFWSKKESSQLTLTNNEKKKLNYNFQKTIPALKISDFPSKVDLLLNSSGAAKPVVPHPCVDSLSLLSLLKEQDKPKSISLIS